MSIKILTTTGEAVMSTQEEYAYHQGGCYVYMKSLNTAMEDVMSIKSAEYHQGGCGVYRKSQNTTKEVVMSIESV